MHPVLQLLLALAHLGNVATASKLQIPAVAGIREVVCLTASVTLTPGVLTDTEAAALMAKFLRIAVFDNLVE